MKKIKTLSALYTLILFLVASGCNISKINTVPEGAVKYQVGGVVFGLANGEQVVLQNNSVDTVIISGTGSGNDPFAFPTKLASGQSYYVTVFSQPAGKTCIAGGNLGTVGNLDIATVQVNCSTTTTFTIGGNITGLVGSGLLLKNTRSGGTIDFASPNAGAVAYTFPSTLSTGNTYNVSIFSQPTNPSQSCTVASASGTVGTTPITNVHISCSSSMFIFGGNISGLQTGESITLSDGVVPAGSLTVNGTASGVSAFNFPARNDLTAYNVTVTTPPAGKTCMVTNGGGALAGANVNNIVISCAGAGSYFVQGTAATGISGLSPKATIGLNLTATGVNEFLSVTNGSGTVSANLPYTFANTFATGASITVSISQQPLHQTCTAGGSLGPITVSGANVVLPLITCTTNTFAVGGTLTGLAPGDSVTLKMDSYTNGVPNAPPSPTANATAAAPTFSFPAIDDGSTYTVTVTSFVPGPLPSVSKNCGPTSGVINGAAANLSIPCNPNPTVSVTLSGLSTPSSGLGLRLNGNPASNILATANSPTVYTFTSPVLNPGDNYSVSIYQQPDRSNTNSINQQCYLSPNATGVMPAVPGNISVTATCSTVAYTVSGSITGLAMGEQVPIVNNGTSGAVASGGGTGTDTYTSLPVNDGTNLTLGIGGNPSGKVCVFTNGTTSVSIPIAGANITTGTAQNVICGTTLAGPPDVSTTSRTGSTISLTSDYYVIPVSTGHVYAAGLTALTQNLDLYVYSTPDFAPPSLLCSSVTPGAANETCNTPAVTGSLLYIRVNNTAGVTSTYTLSILMSGALANPIALVSPPVGTPTTIAGSTIAGNFHYRVPVTVGNSYQVDVTGLTGNLDLAVYSTADYTTTLKCDSLNPGTQNESCALYTNAGETNLYIKIKNPPSTPALPFTVTITNLGVPPAVGASSAVAPIALAQALPGTPTVVSLSTNPNTTDVFYSIPVAASTGYTFTLGGLNVNYDLKVFTNPNFVTLPLACGSANPGLTTDSCNYLTTAAGTLYIRIVNTAAATGVFGLTVNVVPVVGASGVAAPGPIGLTQAFPNVPTVVPLTLNPSTTLSVYYSIPVSTATYIFSLTGLSQDYDLEVYSTPDFATTLACVSAFTLLSNETCSYYNPTPGTLYIKVLNWAGAAGFYQLKVMIP